MAFLESHGVHYRACCDECGAIGVLSETMAGSVKATEGWTWKSENDPVRCATCSKRCRWGECTERALTRSEYCHRHWRAAQASIKRAFEKGGK